jgi:hypothetical protein
MLTPNPPLVSVPVPEQAQNEHPTSRQRRQHLFRESLQPSDLLASSEWKYPIDEAIGKSLFFTKSSGSATRPRIPGCRGVENLTTQTAISTAAGNDKGDHVVWSAAT